STTKIGAALDDIVANLMTGVHGVLQDRIDGWVDELKGAIGVSHQTTARRPGGYATGPVDDFGRAQAGRAD
ncbi:MAG TPA: hypothetical protein VJN70_14050, partial [Gemmatimonadaceae bacterium]|nr:hypothetical protein [Gemmatimonadaceae bacterium]